MNAMQQPDSHTAAEVAAQWWTTYIAAQTWCSRKKLRKELLKLIKDELRHHSELYLQAYDPNPECPFGSLALGGASPVLRLAMREVGIRRYRDGSFGRFFGRRIVWDGIITMTVTPTEVTVEDGYEPPGPLWIAEEVMA